METNTRLTKRLTASVAARLNVGDGDLPRLRGAWTRGDVDRLGRDRPLWLIEARRGCAARQDAEAAQRRARHAAMFDEGGFTRPDDGSDDMICYADEAYSYLTAVRGVSAIDAADAVGLRWPSWFAGDEPDDVGWW